MYDLATHNGTITVKNPETGKHRTFRIKTVKKGGLKGQRIVELMTGSDNRNDFHGFGFITQDGQVQNWQKKSTLIFRQLGRIVANPGKYPGLEYKFEGKCRVCNRKLTVPASIDSGIGPVCAGRL